MVNNMPASIKKSQGFYQEFVRKGGAAPRATHYCAGCGHGILHKLIAEAMAELNIQDKTVFVTPVGCGAFCYYYFDCGNVAAAHGRAAAVATGISRTVRDSVVIAYQGDGDLGAIGFNNAFQAANRGDHFAHFFVNNAIYGMTGGQMAPTSLLGMKTTTSPYGRDAFSMGYPLHVSEVFNQLKAPVYIERCSLADTPRIMKAKRAVRKALEIQRDGKGYAFVEILSPCPTNMHTDALGAAKWVIDVMEKEYPLGCLRDRSAEAGLERPHFEIPSIEKLLGVDQGGGLEEPINDDTFTEKRLKFSGFGGQGVLRLGLTIAEAAQHARRHVSWFPSYGPEQRGGSASCAVVVSGKKIGSPVVEEIDTLVAMNQVALERFMQDVCSGGVLIYDNAIPVEVPVKSGVKLIGVPASGIANENGVPMAANTVMLAALAATGSAGLPKEMLLKALEEGFRNKPAVLQKNRHIFEIALQWCQTNIK